MKGTRRSIYRWHRAERRIRLSADRVRAVLCSRRCARPQTRSLRGATAAAAAVALALAGCGGGERRAPASSGHVPGRDRRRAFPARQRLAEHVELRHRRPQRGHAHDPERRRHDRGRQRPPARPSRRSAQARRARPRLALAARCGSSTTGPLSGDTAYANTWALGADRAARHAHVHVGVVAGESRQLHAALPPDRLHDRPLAAARSRTAAPPRGSLRRAT